jgi:hypothetical protein
MFKYFELITNLGLPIISCMKGPISSLSVFLAFRLGLFPVKRLNDLEQVVLVGTR